jgi:hypothetical protein
MKTRPQESANRDFLIGLMSGSAIGAGVAMLFAPRPTSKLRRRFTAVSATEKAIEAGNPPAVGGVGRSADPGESQEERRPVRS